MLLQGWSSAKRAALRNLPKLQLQKSAKNRKLVGKTSSKTHTSVNTLGNYGETSNCGYCSAVPAAAPALRSVSELAVQSIIMHSEVATHLDGDGNVDLWTTAVEESVPGEGGRER